MFIGFVRFNGAAALGLPIPCWRESPDRGLLNGHPRTSRYEQHFGHRWTLVHLAGRRRGTGAGTSGRNLRLRERR